MLPYDNKNEFQIVVDMPEGTTLEQTDAVARRLGATWLREAEVRDYQLYVGLASPMDFNGMVRHYFLRRGPQRGRHPRQSGRPKTTGASNRTRCCCGFASRWPSWLARWAPTSSWSRCRPARPCWPRSRPRSTDRCRPVLRELIAVARQVRRADGREPGVVDVDISAEDDQVQWVFETDKPKAALSGVSTEAMAETLQLALGGLKATVLHLPSEVDPLWIELRLPRAKRSAIDDLKELYVRGEEGQMVQLGSIGQFVEPAGRPDDLPQEPAAGGLRLRRSGRASAGRRDHRHAIDRVAAGEPLPAAAAA